MRQRPDTVRRMMLGLLLALAAGASVGDDVVTAPDVRRGSHAVTVDLPDPLGATSLYVPRTPPVGVALLVHDGDPRALVPLLDTLAATTLIVPVDASTPALRSLSCEAAVDVLAAASRQAQREAGLTAYALPVVVGVGRAREVARDVVLASPPGLFAAGLGAAATERSPQSRPGPSPCPGTRARPGDHRWHDVAAGALASETAALLGRPSARPTTGHPPLDRWLTHFALPMSATWVARPRAVVVLMSDARVLRQPYPDLADGLAARDVSVLTIDALRYFWQRRSPRDVAFELRRLIGALASLRVPVVVGGLGSGAETMAVAARYIESDPPDGLVLIDPGPSAFFEVDPPLPALVPLIRPEWSTSDAVAALDLPTLCVSTGDARARALCDRLAATPRPWSDGVPRVVADAGAQASGREATSRLAARIEVLAARAARGPRRDGTPDSAGQPRKPST